MAFNLETSLEVDGTPQEIWSVLTNFRAYGEWNPFIFSGSGTAIAGTRIALRMRDAGGSEMSFTPTVRKAEEARELRWLGRLLMPGIFDGEHYFRLEDAGNGKTLLVQGEDFSGVLVLLMRTRLRTRTLPQFRAMNEAIAKRIKR